METEKKSMGIEKSFKKKKQNRKIRVSYTRKRKVCRAWFENGLIWKKVHRKR